jgi:hypothetical protein
VLCARQSNHVGGVDDPQLHVIGRLGIHIEQNEPVYLDEKDEEKRGHQIVTDFIASFTDGDALRAFEELTYPQKLI